MLQVLQQFKAHTVPLVPHLYICPTILHTLLQPGKLRLNACHLEVNRNRGTVSSKVSFGSVKCSWVW